jgi:hypothetical protein
MSANQMQTVSSFFNLRDGSTAWASRFANSPEFAPVRKRMAQELKGFRAPPGFDELVVRQIGDLLDIELSTVIVGAWCKRQEIVKYRDTKKYSPGDVHLVPLLKHTITSTHSPTIQPIINNVPLPKIKFDVVLKLKMKGMILKIRDARIREILVGSCTGNGSIEYAGHTLLTRETAPVAFPASIVPKKGIAI